MFGTASIGLVILRRLAQAVPTILGVVAINFVLLHLLHGDIVDALTADAPSTGVDFKAQLRSQMGLDQSLPVQFLIYMGHLLRFDFGYSYANSQPVLDVLGARIGPTLLLMFSSILLATVVSVVMGVYAARKVNTWRDNLIMLVALIFYATPVFWTGLMMIVLFAVKLNWLPVGGFATIGASFDALGGILDVLRHLAMPMTALALFFLAVYTRLTRASMLEVYGLDFVRTARAKGLSERYIAFRHVLRNALLPVVTMVGLQAGAVLGGAVVIETVFSWPGLGRLAYEAVLQRDYQVLLAILFFAAIFVIVANLLVDLVYARLDPRITIR